MVLSTTPSMEQTVACTTNNGRRSSSSGTTTTEEPQQQLLSSTSTLESALGMLPHLPPPVAGFPLSLYSPRRNGDVADNGIPSMRPTVLPFPVSTTSHDDTLTASVGHALTVTSSGSMPTQTSSSLVDQTSRTTTRLIAIIDTALELMEEDDSRHDMNNHAFEKNPATAQLLKQFPSQ